ncbi:hypothetical protein [Pantoea sp. aB]|uniref:hypothetical protein n=1 Tax=Pantoea sp. aB TaxID=517433 RepID=UPI0001E0C273|nr:hypothetical protein [Pantoea sp. aB]EFM19404.1 hypothetical protein PanABDRAFT_2555 [Pantoea sp. aB]
MLNPEFIDKIYGVGSYVLINCSSEFSSYFLSAGYTVFDIQDCKKAVAFDADNNYDYLIINFRTSNDNIGFNDFIENHFRCYNHYKKILFNIDEGTQKLSQSVEFQSIIKNYGFKHDIITTDLLAIYPAAQSCIPLISVTLAPYHDGAIKKENSLRELTQYVRPNETVGVIYENCDYFSDLISQTSIIRDIKKFKNDQSFFKGVRFINDVNERIGRGKKKYFDCIFILSGTSEITNLDALIKYSENLSPGGRIIFSSDSFQDLRPGNRFEVEVAYTNNERLISNNFCGCDIIQNDLDGYFVVMKDPLNDIDKFEYIEKTYLYSSPPMNLIMFQRDYHNPWLLKAMVEFPTRNKNKFALKRYAEKILKEYDDTLPDFAAAIAILGYQSFSDEQNIPFIIDKVIHYVHDVDKIKKKSAHQMRWLISLSVLGAELLKLNNKKNEALKLYLKAISYPFNKFSPTIGTKVLQAYYNIAMILYMSGDKISSINYLSEGLEKGIDILNVSYEELLGKKEKPLVFTLFIYHDIIDWMIKIIYLKNHLGFHDNLIPSLNSNVWSILLKERMDAIKNMNSMIKERDNTISTQGGMLEERMNGINELELVIHAQQRLIEERWEAMQEMEKMIIERDNTISELKNLI